MVLDLLTFVEVSLISRLFLFLIFVPLLLWVGVGCHDFFIIVAEKLHWAEVNRFKAMISLSN